MFTFSIPASVNGSVVYECREHDRQIFQSPMRNEGGIATSVRKQSVPGKFSFMT